MSVISTYVWLELIQYNYNWWKEQEEYKWQAITSKD